MQPLVYVPGAIESVGISYVLVNGKRIDHVVMADPHRGVVDAYVAGKDGLLRTDKYGKHILSKRYRGKVEVIFRGESSGGCND